MKRKEKSLMNMVTCIRVSKRLTFVKIDVTLQFELELLGDLNQDAPRFTTD